MDLILHKCFVIHWKLLFHSLLHRGTTFLLEAVCNCVSIPQDKGPVKPIDFCTIYVFKRRCCHTGITRCGRCEVSARRPALKSDKREKECCHTVFKTPHRHYNEKLSFSHLEMQGCHSSASASGKTLHFSEQPACIAPDAGLNIMMGTRKQVKSFKNISQWCLNSGWQNRFWDTITCVSEYLLMVVDVSLKL